MADGNQIAAILGGIGAIGGIGGLVKAVTVDRHSVSRSQIEVLEERNKGYRRELDEVRERLNECRRREIEQGERMARMQGEIEVLKLR